LPLSPDFVHGDDRILSLVVRLFPTVLSLFHILRRGVEPRRYLRGSRVVVELLNSLIRHVNEYGVKLVNDTGLEPRT
jgi:hypothetical protein